MALEVATIEENSSKSVTPSRSKEEKQKDLLFPTGVSPASPEAPLLNCPSITDLPPALLSEILRRLDARGLGVVSCVSTLLNSLASENQGWKDFYHDRWGPPLPPKAPSRSNDRSWKNLFMEREDMSRAFMGKYSVDVLHGHTETVRAVFLLAPVKLAFTGGCDSVVRMWDVEEGILVAASPPLGCTIRAIVADMDLLVAAGTDTYLQCWKAVQGHPVLFDISGNGGVNCGSKFQLWGHYGPVTCLALDTARIYSGSWDMSMRIWDRTTFQCLSTLMHCDWVWSLNPCGSTVASTAGRDVYIWDVVNGSLIKVINEAHTGIAVSLARSYSGNLLFTGGEDGAIHMYEIVSQECSDVVKPVATWMPHSSVVTSLSFEFPWLVSCSADGRLALIDIRKLLKPNRRSLLKNHHGAEQSTTATIESPQRMLHGMGCALLSVDIGADRIVCGGEDGSVRLWNFSQALEIERRTRALRRVQMENRMRRKKNQLEMNNKAGRNDQCSVVAKRNQVNGNGNGIWHSKRALGGKLQA